MRTTARMFAIFVPVLVVLGSVLPTEADVRQPAGPKLDCQSAFDPFVVDKAALLACGFKVYPQERIRVLPDGGKESSYTVAGHKEVHRVPPKGFNPVLATPSTLDFYGLPPKPTTPNELKVWEYQMSILHPVDLPAYQIEGLPRADVSAVWSGYHATSGSSTAYNFTEGIWNEVQALSTPCSNNTALTWEGLGGWGGVQQLAQAGTGVNTPSLGQHQAWYEVLPDQPSLHPEPLYAHAGYGFAAFTSWHGGYYAFYLQDFYSGSYISFNYYTGSYNGASADFVIERAQNNGSPLNLTNFSYLTYKDAWVNGTSASNGVGNYPNSEIDMTTYPNGSGNLLAYASGLSNNGQTFTDYYNYCQ